MSDIKLIGTGVAAGSTFILYLFDYFSFYNTIKIAIGVFVLTFFLLSDSDLTLQILEKYGKKNDKLKGKVVWITGASTGIGEACALELAKAQCKLILSARSKDKLDAVKKKCIEVGKLSYKDILVLSFDILNYDMHKSVYNKAINHFEKIDILMSNAGASQRVNFVDITTEVDKELFDLNVFSLMSLARIVTKHFLEIGGGHHVVTSSIAGKIGSPFQASYSAAKHALHGYFETLRSEHGADGVAVTLLDIGPVQSNIMALAFTGSSGNRGLPERKEKIMSTSRCAQLVRTAITNRLPEVVISLQPTLAFSYFAMYCTTCYQWLQTVINMKNIVRKSRSMNEDGS